MTHHCGIRTTDGYISSSAEKQPQKVTDSSLVPQQYSFIGYFIQLVGQYSVSQSVIQSHAIGMGIFCMTDWRQPSGRFLAYRRMHRAMEAHSSADHPMASVFNSKYTFEILW